MVGPTGRTSSYPFPGLCPVSPVSFLGSPQTSCWVVSDFPGPYAGGWGATHCLLSLPPYWGPGSYSLFALSPSVLGTGGGGGYSLSALSPSVLGAGGGYSLLSLPFCCELGGLLTVCSLSPPILGAGEGYSLTALSPSVLGTGGGGGYSLSALSRELCAPQV